MHQKNNNKLLGATGFENYYSSLYKERWAKLRNSLLDEVNYATFQFNNCEKYFLDSASVLASLSLPLSNATRILDLCAAPGGKTLLLASRMSERATLFANERSKDRYAKMINVLHSCLPDNIYSRIKTFCSDGAKMCKNNLEEFDCILLDAPCSSERHVISNKKYLEMWSSARIKTVTFTQWALLSSAFRMLKKGGYLLYSTCALCPSENDFMINKMLNKFDSAKLSEISYNEKEIEKVCKLKLPSFEKTEYGFHILPDVQNGAGPIYFSIINKA